MLIKYYNCNTLNFVELFGLLPLFFFGGGNKTGIFVSKFVNTCFMKKLLTVEQAKQMIQELKGHKVMVKLNKGRNRIKKCSGKVVEVHPNVFVIELLGDLFDRISCTYVDVICGEVSLTK